MGWGQGCQGTGGGGRGVRARGGGGGRGVRARGSGRE